MEEIINTDTTLHTTTKRQKVVILPGPHKTGTTSVQSFLASLSKKNLLGDWEWPASSSKAFSDVAHSVLLDNEDKHGILKRKRAKVQEAWKKRHNIVLGAELLDYVAATSTEELSSVFQRLYSIFPSEMDPTKDMTTVVMYRTPRSSHLVSAWKQQIAMAKRRGGGGHIWRRAIEKEGVKKGKAPTLSQWLCNGTWEGKMEFNVNKIIETQVNPMGVARAFLRYGNTSIVVGDMSNMTDISNTVACEVLGVPCTKEQKVVGWNKTKPKLLNQRENPAPLGFSDAEMIQVEDILRRMDCYYFCGMRENATILHAKDVMFTNDNGWQDCCTSPETFLTPTQAYNELKSIGCHASGISRQTATAFLETF